MEEECSNSVSQLLVKAASLIPISHYSLGITFFFLIILYNFLEIHFFQQLFKGFRGNHVSLTYNSCSQIYSQVASKCPILHARYLVTPWLSSPHLQTAFINFFGRPPVFSYKRQLFTTPDGGTLAWDWLMPCDDTQGSSYKSNGCNAISKDDTTPIVMVIPGLMSDSASPYIKHLAFGIAKSGWNVVVCNHRGLGGVLLTSDWFYNAGWTEDIRTVANYFHGEYPKAPLFAVGTSIGANVLVKYLGEDGDSTPIAGAASICSPWDLLICDRFINRRLVQRLYSRAITTGLQIYAQTHESIYSRLADWEGIRKSRSVRDFDNHATCILGNYETADNYYRLCSSAGYVKNVTVPLLCISALDDPVCTREAIPWDECRANKNVILATTQYGGHLAFFNGITASSLWWVSAIDEFFSVLHSSPFMHKQNKAKVSSNELRIDQGPYVSFTDDGMVAAMGNEGTSNDKDRNLRDPVAPPSQPEDELSGQKSEQHSEPLAKYECDTTVIPVTAHDTDTVKYLRDAAAPVKRQIKELSRHSRTSIWLLAYIAMITTWPLLGPAMLALFRRKVRNVLPASWLRK